MANQTLRRQKLGTLHHLDRLFLVGAGGDDKDFALGGELRIVDVDLHQEPVELRLGQRIGAFLFQWVLGGQNMEWLWQLMITAGDRNPPFLHCLQQRRLGPRARPVDFIRHQQLAEHWSLDEAE